MIQYIYFVKCPDCEDEPFDFFNDAKAFARGCLSKKPIITQIEVDRNDFGECVDSSDLGTIWSWEDECRATEAEPAVSIFTKGDFAKYNPDRDEEFDALDNSVDFEVEEVLKESVSKAELEKAFNDAGYATEPGTYDFKTIYDNYVKKNHKNPEALFDIIQFIEAEVAKHHAKEKANGKSFDDATKTLMYKVKLGKPIPEGMTIEQLVEEMEENEDEVECTWCNDLFDKSECRKEVNLGWLCSRCEAAIKSRGETLTFKENNYWDFLDESMSDRKTVELHYDRLTVPVVTKVIPATRLEPADTIEKDCTDEFDYEVEANEVATVIWENFLTEEDVADVPGGFDTLEDDEAWHKYLEEHFDDLVEKYNKELLEYFEDKAIEAAQEKFQSDYDNYEPNYEPEYDYWEESLKENSDEAKSMLEDLEDGETYRKRLSLCPECGTDTFDSETGICINCGFNIFSLEEELDQEDIKTITDIVNKANTEQEKNITANFFKHQEDTIKAIQSEADFLADGAFKHQENVIKAVERENDLTFDSLKVLAKNDRAIYNAVKN